MRSDLEKFTRLVIRSGLMTSEELRDFCASFPQAARPNSAMALARELVSRQVLTSYQAGRILSGQWQRLVLGNIAILDKLAEGGMGEVFRAEHRRMKRIVVVKILPEFATRNATLLRRFQREVQATARLIHPNIVTAYDADELDGTYFLVMEYVEGKDLGTLIDRHGPFPLESAVSCILQAARGLLFAHSQGVVHRDIKPSNLLLDRSNTIKILDMGLARILDEELPEQGDSLTDQRNILGTVEYMSPEQADDSSEVDHRTDIYSLGCTLFRILVGVPPYRRKTPFKTLIAHRTAAIPSLCEVRTDVPKSLDQAFQRMVAKAADDRFSNMQEVIDALTACLNETEFEVGAIRLPSKELSQDDTNSEATGPSDAIDFGTRVGEASTGVGSDHTVILTKESTSSLGLLRMRGSSHLRSKHTAIGIDLGTTFSAVAWLDESGRPQTLVNDEGESLTPSVVLFDDGEIVVGKEASKAMATDIDHIAMSPKRDLGLREYHQTIRGRSYPPEVLEAWILRKLARDAQRQVGDIQQVVVTVPAYFDEVRRKATVDAGYIAGLNVIDIINEPTAAALAFGYQRGFLDPDKSSPGPSNVLIYDLGGGTFDVTIMEMRQSEFRTLATDGDVQLGGLDWDQRLIDHVAQLFVLEHGDDPRQDAGSKVHLWRACDEAKRTLSARKRATVICHHLGKRLDVTITRDEFETMTADLLDRTSMTARHTLEASGLTWPDIHHVLMVGGSSRMPAVRELLRDLSGREPDSSVSPDEAIAHGAALHAQLLVMRSGGVTPPFRVTNVNSHSLGVVAVDATTRKRQNAILIPRNTPLPATARRVFLTQKDNQRSILINIVEGETTDPADCSQVGKCVVRDLPANLPRHTAIDVRFRYEENGRLTVNVDLPQVGTQARHYLARDNMLSQAELDDWRRIVSGHAAEPQSQSTSEAS